MDFLLITFSLVGVPISVYFSVKFGRYAYLRADQMFAERNRNRVDTSTHTQNQK